MADKSTIRTLVTLGAVIAIVEVVLWWVGRGVGHSLVRANVEAVLWQVLVTIIVVVLAIILLGSVGAIKKKTVGGSAVLFIVLGILLVIFGAWIGGIIVLIAGIVALL
ncbi:MAG: hypothetical protein Kow0069_39510 [Promethearchaeota archaeon]